MQRLIKSAKFWTLMIDVIITLILYFVGKYASASIFEDTKLIILTIQPVFLMMIGSIAAEDIAIARSR